MNSRLPTGRSTVAPMWGCSVVVVVTWSLLMTSVGAAILDEFDAKRLYDDLLKKSEYNRVIRPVDNVSDSLPVRVGLRLTSIIDVVRTVCSSSYCNHS